MHGTWMLYVDQYGNRFGAKSVKELREQIGGGGGRVYRMYNDSKSKGTVHVGYVIGAHWLTAYVPYQGKA